MLLQNEAWVCVLMEQRGDVWVGCDIAQWIPLRRSSDQCVSKRLLEVYLSPTPSIHPLIFRKMIVGSVVHSCCGVRGQLFLKSFCFPATCVAFWIVKGGTNQRQSAQQSGKMSISVCLGQSAGTAAKLVNRDLLPNFRLFG